MTIPSVLREMDGFSGLSFIICHRDHEDISKTIFAIHDAWKGITFSDCDYEIILARGNHPSLQRNMAVDEARFSHLYFLDNDSIINKESLGVVLGLLTSPEGNGIAILGGPSVLPADASFFERCVDGLLTSYPVVGRRRARYLSVGSVRESGGSELILCNMVVSRKIFIDFGGFDYRLYPNEENEFIHRAASAGKIVYHPDMVIHRHQRRSYGAFLRQMFHYGRGKSEEMKIEFGGFKTYLLRGLMVVLGMGLLGILGIGGGEIMNLFERPVIHFSRWAPHLVFWYWVYIAFTMVKASVRKKTILLHYPALVCLGHLFYGLGLGYLLKNRFFSERKKYWFRVTGVTPDITPDNPGNDQDNNSNN